MKPGIKQGLFLRIEEFARRRYGLVFLVTLLLVVVSLFLGTRLSLDGDVLNLAPRNNRIVDTFREAIEDFGSLDYLLVLVEARDGQGVEDLETFADALADGMTALPSVIYVEHKIDTSSPLFAFLRRNQTLFLPREKIPELAAKFSDEAIRNRVRENYSQLTGPSSFLAKRILEQDPFLISPLLVEAMMRSKGPLRFDLNGGYFLSKDGGALLIIVKPTKPAQNLAFNGVLIKEVDGVVERVSSLFQKELAEEGAAIPGNREADRNALAPHVSYGGGYMVVLADSELIKQDMRWNGPLSFFLIILLYYFCYRRFGAILYSSVPLVVGQIFTLAIAYICLRNLNSATTGFSAMLMGLGTDFTIVMYARYVEERSRGKSMPEALRLMMGVSAFGVFTGAITSAGTFYAMCVTEYKGLRDFGFLVGSGILLCLVSILFLMPAMIAWNEGRRRKTDVTKKLYLHSFGIQKLITLSTRYPLPVVIGSVLVTAIAGYWAWNVEFSDSVKDLRSPNNAGIIVQNKIGERFGANFHPMMVICRARDLDTLLRKNREVNRTLERFKQDGTLLGYESITNYLPPREDQQAVIAALHEEEQGAFNIVRIERTFRTALRDYGFREGVYDDYIDALPATLHPERPITIGDLNQAGLERFVTRYVRPDEGGGYRSVTHLFPADPEAKRNIPPGLQEALDNPAEGIELTGVNIVSTEMRRIFKRDAWRAILVGIALVSVLLWLDFRSWRLMLLANIQVLVGVVWMLGAMYIFGIKMNFVNAFVTTMILGVGIDYGIHIIHRISQEGLSNPTGLLETGKAVVMAALTNIAGFGALGVSNYPGLSSMGLICTIGSFTCLITALTMLPALMVLTRTGLAPRHDVLKHL